MTVRMGPFVADTLTAPDACHGCDKALRKGTRVWRDQRARGVPVCGRCANADPLTPAPPTAPRGPVHVDGQVSIFDALDDMGVDDSAHDAQLAHAVELHDVALTDQGVE